MIFLRCRTGYFSRGLVLPRYLVLHRDKFSHKKEAPENSSHLVTLTLMTEQLVQKQMPNHRIPTPKLLLSTTFLCTLSHFGQKYVSYLYYHFQHNNNYIYHRILSVNSCIHSRDQLFIQATRPACWCSQLRCVTKQTCEFTVQ